MALTAGIVAAVSAVGSGVASNRAASAQNKAQKRAAALERAQARIQNQREMRKAVAERRIQQAQLQAAAGSDNLGSNSAVSGAVGAIGSDTATAVGAARTQLAARTGQSLILQRGASESTRFQSISNTLGAVSSVAGAYAARKATTDAIEALNAPGDGAPASIPGNGRFGNVTNAPNSARGKFGPRF